MQILALLSRLCLWVKQFTFETYAFSSVKCAGQCWPDRLWGLKRQCCERHLNNIILHPSLGEGRGNSRRRLYPGLRMLLCLSLDGLSLAGPDKSLSPLTVPSLRLGGCIWHDLPRKRQQLSRQFQAGIVSSHWRAHSARESPSLSATSALLQPSLG